MFLVYMSSLSQASGTHKLWIPLTCEREDIYTFDIQDNCSVQSGIGPAYRGPLVNQSVTNLHFFLSFIKKKKKNTNLHCLFRGNNYEKKIK